MEEKSVYLEIKKVVERTEDQTTEEKTKQIYDLVLNIVDGTVKVLPETRNGPGKVDWKLP